MADFTLTKSPRELRDEVEQLIRDDLVGPRGGDEEELRDPPVDVYLLGLLAPRFGPAPTSGDDEDDSIASDQQPDEPLAKGGMRESGAEGSAEERPPAADQLVPQAFGLTFAVDDTCEALVATASWGAYTKDSSAHALTEDGRPERIWKRRACGGAQTFAVPRRGAVAPFVPDPEEPDVKIRGIVRDRGGHRLISLFLVNGQQAEKGRSVERWLCQTKLSVAGKDGAAVFVRRALDPVALAPAADRIELRSLEMQHRGSIELAVGHGVAVSVVESPGDPGRGIALHTEAMPAEEVPQTEAPTAADFEDADLRDTFAQAEQALDMRRLSEAADDELQSLLGPLVDAYAAWIAGQKRRLADPTARLDGHGDAARDNLAAAEVAATRIRTGIKALGQPDVAEAFRFANHAMWQQRVHTIAAEARRRDPALKLHQAVEHADIAKNRSWRPFQLAFVLLNLPSLAHPTHPERQDGDGLVDLLFFPTGGGKTEAYLGLTAFTIAIRRLQGVMAGRDGRDGVAVLMRYTLRLLTLQQFQRAAALLCACELRRRELYGPGQTPEQRRWGITHMRIGLWVGEKSTPNRTEDAARWVEQARQRQTDRPGGSSPLQLARCPWCGSELKGGRDVEVDKLRGRTLLSCSDTSGQCAFTQRQSPGEGLPVVVVDEELYRLLPSLVISTVDKLARMPWEGRAQALFGQVERSCSRHGFLTPSTDHDAGSHPKRGKLAAATVTPCEPLRPPDLIIQDELHLISGPLGSLVGLYETAVDALCSWSVDGAAARPKIIASTATIRRASDQVMRLFHRHLEVFPPPGLDARDSFFALQRDSDEDKELKPGRRYLGVCAPGRRYKQVLIRVYVAQLMAAWTVLGRQPGAEADAYMTLVGYFNSLRELGGMRRLVEDDVQSRLFEPGKDSRGRLIVEELTSRKSAGEIPSVLDQLSVQRLATAKRGPRKDGDGPPSIDVLLATNMISVGVDVPRLGAMVVAGQPKATSEYIQATSRVGRAHPGMVIAVYNWARPRDLSHYETFCHYHRTLYRQVEALSVTPFAPRARDRGLTGVLASLLRLCDTAWNDNRGAGKVDGQHAHAKRAVKTITSRAAGQVGKADADALAETLVVRLQAWKAEAEVGQRHLVYKARGKSDTEVSLLQEPGVTGWTAWTVPNSMREVETPVPLALRGTTAQAGLTPWDPPERSAPIPDLQDDA